jgi:hypothetical protein
VKARYRPSLTTHDAVKARSYHILPGWTEWQIEQFELNTDLPAAGSAAFACHARNAKAEKHVTAAAKLRGISLLLVSAAIKYRLISPYLGSDAMPSTRNLLAAVSMAYVVAACIMSGPVVAQAPAHVGEIPQSIRLEHENTVEQLTNLSRKHGPLGVEASKALALFKAHLQREQEFILPPLSLLLQLADGKTSPDMKWAIAMADRVRSERELTYQEHTKITDAMNALAAAARKDAEALDFARGAVADSLNDVELLEPMSIVIGEYPKSKLGTSGRNLTVESD